jgi:hypothetical protein
VLPFDKDIAIEDSLLIMHILLINQKLDNDVIEYDMHLWPRLDSIQEGKKQLQCYRGKCKQDLLKTSTLSTLGKNERVTNVPFYLTTIGMSILNIDSRLDGKNLTPTAQDSITEEITLTQTDVMTMKENVTNDNWTVPGKTNRVVKMERGTYYIIGLICSMVINVVLVFILIFITCKIKLHAYHTTNTTEDIEMENV